MRSRLRGDRFARLHLRIDARTSLRVLLVPPELRLVPGIVLQQARPTLVVGDDAQNLEPGLVRNLLSVA